MMRFPLLIVLASYAILGNAEDCESQMGERCLPKSEAPDGFKGFYSSDPCFEYGEMGKVRSLIFI